MNAMGSRWWGTVALFLAATLLMSSVALTASTRNAFAAESGSPEGSALTAPDALTGAEGADPDAIDDGNLDDPDAEQGASDQPDGESGGADEGSEPSDEESDSQPVGESPETDPPETPPPDGDSEHVEDQEHPEEPDPVKPDGEEPPLPQDKDPPEPGEEDPSPTPTVTPTPAPKPSTPPPRPAPKPASKPPTKPPAKPAPPPYVPNPWAPAGSHTTSLQPKFSPGSHSPVGLQGAPAPRTGLIGDDYPMKYKMLPAFPIVWDEWNFAHRQCTSFVAWRLQNVNKVSFSNFALGVARWGNAGQWGDAARSAGIRVDTTPAAGAVAYSAPYHNGTGSAGHVAWVAQVLDDNRIVIEEYNWGFPAGHYGARIVTPEAFTGYIHIRDLVSAPQVQEPVQTTASLWFEGQASTFAATGRELEGTPCRMYFLGIQICRNPALFEKLLVPAEYRIPAELPLLFEEAPVVNVFHAVFGAGGSKSREQGTP